MKNQVGPLTQKQALALFDMEPIKCVSKLFNGTFDTVELSLIDPTIVRVKFTEAGKPGFKMNDYYLETVQKIRNDWINSPILNRSGLATLIWDDLTPNNLRRRLEQRVQHLTLTHTEQEIIVREVEKFLNMIKVSFDIE